VGEALLTPGAGVGFVFLGVSALLGAAAAREIRRRRAFLAVSAKAVGEIIGFREQHDRGDVYLHPRIRFRTAAGHPIEFESQVGSERPSDQIGDAVPVRYRADAPNEAEIDRWLALWGTALFAGGGAMLTAGIAAAALIGWIPL